MSVFRDLAVTGLLLLCAQASLRAQAPMEASAEAGIRIAIRDAQMLVRRHPGAEVRVVRGESMLPYFGAGAVVVLRPIEAQALRAGMIVVYRNRFGEQVSHRLVREREGGWEVRGYNNDRADSTLVTADNLQGVVYAILHPRPSSIDSLADAGPGLSVETVLAAPAR